MPFQPGFIFVSLSMSLPKRGLALAFLKKIKLGSNKFFRDKHSSLFLSDEEKFRIKLTTGVTAITLFALIVEQNKLARLFCLSNICGQVHESILRWASALLTNIKDGQTDFLGTNTLAYFA